MFYKSSILSFIVEIPIFKISTLQLFAGSMLADT